MEEKIVVKQTCIEIHNYHLGDNKVIEDKLSVWNKVSHTRIPLGRYYDEDLEVLYLPRGMDVGGLEQLFQSEAYFDYKFDKPDIIEPFGMKYKPRDETQREALEFTLGINKYARIKNASQLSVNLDTGVGKTYVAIFTADYLQYRTMIITSELGWLEQWKDRILEYTNLSIDDLCFVSGMGVLNRLRTGMKDPKQYSFYLASHRTLQMYGQKFGWERLGELFQHLGIGMKVFDEAHKYFVNMSMIDFFTNTKKTLYLTATPYLSDKFENYVFQTYFKNVPKIQFYDESRYNRSHYINISYNSRPAPKDLKFCANRIYKFSIVNYCANVFTRPNVYKVLTIVLYMAATHKGKILFYIGRNDAIKMIKNWIEVNFPLFAGSIGIYNGTIPKDKKIYQLDNKIILSNVKSSGACSDISDLAFVCPIAEPSASAQIAKQMKGRLDRFNGDTYFIDITDRGFDATRGFHNARKRVDVFKKFCNDSKDMIYNDETLNSTYMDAYQKLNQMYWEKMQNVMKTQKLKEIVKRVEK